MNKIEKIKTCIISPEKRFYYMSRVGILNCLSDERFLGRKYFLNFGKRINLDYPKTFNEKLNWLKLHDRKDIYTRMVDKAEAKKYVSGIIGEEYIIPTIGVYEKFDDIGFDKLPDSFVIKCTHNSGGIVVCKDKTVFNQRAARKTINRAMKRNYYYGAREWPYKNIKPRIIVEQFVKDDIVDDLRDYKFMCFNGNPKYVYITVKNDNIFENYYDMNFKPVGIDHGFPRSSMKFKKPELFSEMKDIAKKLSKDIPFLRVDLHYVNGKILFGEMTFYDWAGLRPFPDEGKWDEKLGNLLVLGNEKEGKK